MSSPERVNVMLSRARNGLIMIGNSHTFKRSKKGKDTWTRLFDMFFQGKHIYNGFPVYCERHPDRKALCCTADEFDEKCPSGGCTEPWYVPTIIKYINNNLWFSYSDVMLNCNLHMCPSRCHNIVDHSKINCEEPVNEKCPRGHPLHRKCYQPPKPICKVCDREDKKAREKAEADLREKELRDKAEQQHLKEIAAIEAEIEKEQRKKKEAMEAQQREKALKQKQADLARLRAQAALPTASMSTPQVPPKARQQTTSLTSPPAQFSATSTLPDPCSPLQTGPSASILDEGNLPSTAPPTGNGNINNLPPSQAAAEFAKKPPSPSVMEWERQKSVEGAMSQPIDEIMAMVGLEEVKKQVLAIKAKIDTCVRQGSSLAKERFNISFLGNPGTGT